MTYEELRDRLFPGGIERDMLAIGAIRERLGRPVHNVPLDPFRLLVYGVDEGHMWIHGLERCLDGEPVLSDMTVQLRPARSP